MTLRNAATLTCFFEAASSSGPVLKKIEVKNDTYVHTIDLRWAWAAKLALREDVIVFIEGLIKRCSPAAGSALLDVHTENFFADLPGLRFENLKILVDAAGLGTLSLHITKGAVPHLFAEVADEKIHAPIDDVFLPLTNLVSYLHAMKHQSGDAGSVRAIERTADRLEEFLVIYGGRLQGSVLQGEQKL